MPMDRRLYAAVKEGDMKVVEEYKSQFAIQLTPYNNTVLHIIAAQTKDLNLKINPKDFLALAGPDLFSSLNSNGDTFIHVAAREVNTDLVEAFISYMKNCGGLYGVIDIEAGIRKTRELLRITNNYGNTALHEAAIYDLHDRAVVELLVKEDPDFSYPPNNVGKTPLYLAVEKVHKKAVEHILNNSTSLSYGGPYGTTVLHAAAMHYTTECMEMILRKEPSLTKQTDDFGCNPLHFAAYVGFKLSVRTLLMADKHMAYGSTKKENATPLHLAVINNKIEAVEEIIEQCPDSVDAVTSQGQNVLHIAYVKERRKMITLLLKEQNLNRNIFKQRDADGNLAYEVTANVSFQFDHPCFKEFDRINNIMRDEAEFIEKRKKEFKKERVEIWKERANTHLIVVTLILTVSFAAGFTIPGGYNGDDGPNKGMAVISKKTAFKVFAVTDTIAMISSTTAIFLNYLATYEKARKRLRRYETAAVLALVAMLAMMIAFMTGLYVVLPSASLAIFICVICSLSLVVFIFILGKSLYDVSEERKERPTHYYEYICD